LKTTLTPYDSAPAANTGGSTPASSDSKPASNSDSDSNSNSNSNSPSAVEDAPPSPSSTSTSSAVPSNFPVGTWSLVLFLDTVTTGCTSEPDTWTCPPNTDYYDDPQKALTILNWDISGSSGSYKISSGRQDDTFDTTFQNEDLELLDSGKDTERFRFQISRSKTVNMTGNLGGKRGDFECDYGATNMQGFLYTKMQQTYPDDTIAVGKVPNKAWPYGKHHRQLLYGAQQLTSNSRSHRTSRRGWTGSASLHKFVRRRRQPQGSGCEYTVFLSLQELDTPTEVINAIQSSLFLVIQRFLASSLYIYLSSQA
jgi:hypothetical protein